MNNRIGGDYMDINRVKFEESNIGWETVFEVKLKKEEISILISNH